MRPGKWLGGSWLWLGDEGQWGQAGSHALSTHMLK